MNWAETYATKKYADCWTFVRDVYEKEFEISLPEFPVSVADGLPAIMRTMETARVSSNWEKLENPVDPCVVCLSRRKFIHHVGVYSDVDGGKVLHTGEMGGPVVGQSIHQLHSQGYKRILFYGYVPSTSLIESV